MFLYTCRNLKCIGVEYHVTSRYFRDEYKKVDRLFDIFEKLHDKKKQEKTAYDIVDDRFEKIAGLSNVLSGKNVVRAINDVKAGKNVINTFKGNLKYLEPSARKATREAIGTMTKDLSTLKGRVGKEIAKTTGTYGLGAGVLAGGVHSFRKAKNKNEDK